MVHIIICVGYDSLHIKYGDFLLVVIVIISILIGMSVFGIQGARKNSRDARRKSDLEQLRSALELYRADNGGYVCYDDDGDGYYRPCIS